MFTRPQFGVFLAVIIAALSIAFSAGCKIPNLEDASCREAREAAQKFYSFHFGNDMAMKPENLKLREDFLTSELFSSLSSQTGGVDYFTNTDVFPKTFKIGTCKQVSPDEAVLQVQLYWREESGTLQSEVWADEVRRDGKWLLNKVSPDKPVDQK